MPGYLALPKQVKPPEPPVDNGGGTGGGGTGGGGSTPGGVDSGAGSSSGLSSSSVTITAADGTAYDLMSLAGGFRYTLGKVGFDAAQYAAFTDEAPRVAGELFRGARAIPRDMTLPLYVRGETRDQFITRKRDFFSRLSASHGLATLTVAEADGSRRSIGFYFLGQGGEGSADRQQSGPNWARYSLQLRCPDPYWRGAAIHREFSAPSTAKFLGNPFLPFRVQSSQSFGTSTFESNGDQTAYPVWTVQGPMLGLTLKRITPDLPDSVLTLTSTLTATQSLRIDCHPDTLTILRDDGTNLWPGLSDGSEFWEIAPGLNTVQVSVSGGGSTTRISLDAEPRYETV